MKTGKNESQETYLRDWLKKRMDGWIEEMELRKEGRKGEKEKVGRWSPGIGIRGGGNA